MFKKKHRNLNCVASYMDSPDWMKNKNQQYTIILSIKKITNYFEDAVTVALNHEEIGKNPEKNNKN